MDTQTHTKRTHSDRTKRARTHTGVAQKKKSVLQIHTAALQNVKPVCRQTGLYLLVSAFTDDFLEPVESPRRDEQNVGRFHSNRLSSQLSTGPLRHIHHGSF